jgi:hypothetical protein
MTDPLAEAMSMLDAVNNDNSQDFEDFAIDSDEEDDNNLLNELNITDDLVDLGLNETGEKQVNESAEMNFKDGGDTNDSAAVVPGEGVKQATTSDSFAHPLQMMGATVDPLSSASIQQPPATGKTAGVNGTKSSQGASNFGSMTRNVGAAVPLPVSGGEICFWTI